MYTIVIHDHSSPATITKDIDEDQFSLLREKITIINDVTELFSGNQIDLTAPLISNIAAISAVLDYVLSGHAELDHWQKAMEFVIAARFLGIAVMPVIDFSQLLPPDPTLILETVDRLLSDSLKVDDRIIIVQHIMAHLNIQTLATYTNLLAEALSQELKREIILLDHESIELDLMTKAVRQNVAFPRGAVEVELHDTVLSTLICRFNPINSVIYSSKASAFIDTYIYWALPMLIKQFNGKLSHVIWSADCSTLAYVNKCLCVIDLALRSCGVAFTTSSEPPGSCSVAFTTSSEPSGSHLEIPYPPELGPGAKLDISDDGQYIIAYTKNLSSVTYLVAHGVDLICDQTRSWSIIHYATPSRRITRRS